MSDTETNLRRGPLDDLLGTLLETWKKRYGFEFDRKERRIKFWVPGFEAFASETEDNQIKIAFREDGKDYERVGGIADSAEAIEAILFPDSVSSVPAAVRYKDLVPGVGVRVLAKMIDSICVAFIVVGFGGFFDSYLFGVFLAYSWLALSDWFRSPGKSLMKIKTVDYHTGAECSILQSIKRNSPFLVVNIPHRVHRDIVGLDKQAYLAEYTLLALALSVLSISWFLFALVQMNHDEMHRRPGDLFGDTIVIRS